MTTIIPREIRNRKFKQSLMGVDADEVKSYLKDVAAEFEKILTQNAQMEKRLTEQTVKSTLGTKKEAETSVERTRQALNEADKVAGEIIARARKEAGDIWQVSEQEAAELRRKIEREAHEKARRETTLMLSQAKVMADELILNARRRAEEIEAEAKKASESDEVTDAEAWDLKYADEVQSSFGRLIGEAIAKAEMIIQNARAETETITGSLSRRTLGELGKEHERLLAAVQGIVQKSEAIVTTAHQEAEQFAAQRKCDAVEQCKAVLLESGRMAGSLFESVKAQALSRKASPNGNGKPAPGVRKATPRYP